MRGTQNQSPWTGWTGIEISTEEVTADWRRKKVTVAEKAGLDGDIRGGGRISQSEKERPELLIKYG